MKKVEKCTIKPTRNNIIVMNPIKPMSTTIQVTEEVKQAHAQEQLANAEKATVVAKGPTCQEVKVGDEVRLRTSSFMNAEPLEKGKYLVFTEGEVLAIY